MSRSGRYWLAAAVLLCLLLRVPGWYTQDFKDDWVTFEPDEGQHVHAAIYRYNALHDGPPVHDYRGEPWNVRGYGNLIAYVATVWYGPAAAPPVWRDFLMIGRQLSTLFALLLVVIVFRIGRVGGLSPPLAGTAAVLMACCDANATISHYCLPASGYVMWCYLAVLAALRVARSADLTGLGLLALGAAGAVAFKFDVLPLFWGGLLLCLLALRRDIPWWYVPLGTAVVAGWVLVFWYGWSVAGVSGTFKHLRGLNATGVPVDDHWRDNLVVYPAGVLAGVGLPVFGCALLGLRWLFAGRFMRQGADGAGWTKRRWLLLYLTGWLVSEFVVRWSVDTAFIRRVNVFMPAVCLLAAVGLARLQRFRWLRPAVVAYTLAFALVGQSNHWFDTRYAMRQYVNNELPADARIGISGYVSHRGLRKTGFFSNGGWDYAILHETYYSRYWKSMTTPFGLPACCEEVYNCKPKECPEVQALLLGTHPEAELLRAFRPLRIFPERIAYAHFFGNYETFLGTTLVFGPKGTDR